jgi:DNA-binding NarL/FixJ family response regulator
MPNSTQTILYIEDDVDAATLVAEDLSERGYRVRLSGDGHEGLDIIMADPPDLVLCDINLPGLSGFEILARVSETAPRFGHMPFVFLTAFADRDSLLKGRRLGADDFVTKPVDFDLLHAIVATRLARSATNAVWPSPAALNSRERETLTWAARGKTSSEIATILGLSKRTVDFHADNARLKLGATTRIEAAIRAASSRMIQP